MKRNQAYLGGLICVLLLTSLSAAQAESSARERKYIREAEEIMMSKSKKNVPFQVFQPLEDGCLCSEGQYNSLLETMEYDGSTFFWVDVDKRFVADDDTFRKDLFWCGTYSYTNMKDMPRTVNRYSTDRDLAILLIRLSFELFDVDDDDGDEDQNSDDDDDDFDITGSGTGFFITDEGHLLTNYHVIEDTPHTVLIVDHEEDIRIAEVIHTDRKKDLALLRAEGKSIPVNLGVPEDVQSGRTVFALGFPAPELQGVTPKVTMGIISALRGLGDDEDNYQIDVAVQPGNSGGPLFCANGEVIGVVNARVNDSIYMEATGAIAQQINYAIKAEAVLSFLKEKPEVYRAINKRKVRASSQEEAVREITRSLVLILTVE